MGRPWLPVGPDSPIFSKFDEVDEGSPAEPEDLARITSLVRDGEYRFRPEAGRLVMIQAIDPTTGDSLLHTAVRQGTYKGYLELLKEMGRPRWPWHEWARNALITHQNHNGDTVLHVAARNGNQILCTSIVRCASFNHWSAQVPEETDIDKAPEFRVYPDDYWEGMSDALLRFLLLENKIGNTAEDEAREAGHSTVAKWLRNIRDRLDPEGMRSTDAGIVVLDHNVSERFHYKEMTGEEYH